MANKQIQFRRGTTDQNNAFVGADGEITVDMDRMELRLHAYDIEGGVPIPNKGDVEAMISDAMQNAGGGGGGSVDLGEASEGQFLTGDGTNYWFDVPPAPLPEVKAYIPDLSQTGVVFVYPVTNSGFGSYMLTDDSNLNFARIMNAPTTSAQVRVYTRLPSGYETLVGVIDIDDFGSAYLYTADDAGPHSGLGMEGISVSNGHMIVFKVETADATAKHLVVNLGLKL